MSSQILSNTSIILPFGATYSSWQRHKKNYQKQFSIFYAIRKFITLFHKSLPFVHILSQTNPAHIVPSYFYNNFNNILAYTLGLQVTHSLGRAVAQAVSRWLSTAAARVRVRAACWVCGGRSGTGPGFLRVLRFPLPIIPPSAPSS
jgi:hypothetical protein